MCQNQKNKNKNKTNVPTKLTARKSMAHITPFCRWDGINHGNRKEFIGRDIYSEDKYVKEENYDYHRRK